MFNECLKSGNLVADAHSELEEYCPKDQAEELLEVNYREEGKEAQVILLVLVYLLI